MIPAASHDGKVLPLGVLEQNGCTEDYLPGREHLLKGLITKVASMVGREVKLHVVSTTAAFREAIRRKEHGCVVLVCANVHDRKTEQADLSRKRPFMVISPNGNPDEFFFRAYNCTRPPGDALREITKTFTVSQREQISLKSLKSRPGHSSFHTVLDDFGDYVLVTFLRKGLVPCVASA